MVSRPHITPVLCAAAAAAAGFYFFSSLPFLANTAVLSALLAFVCFFRVLSSLRSKSRMLRLTEIYSVVIAAGVCVGICAAGAGRNDVKFGIPHEKITAITGVLLEDPRIISKGRAMAVLSLNNCVNDKKARVSSSGKITVFFPEDSAIRLREFGRGTTVFSEGRLRYAQLGWIYSADSMHIVKRAPEVERMRTGVRLGLINRFDGKPWGGLALSLLVGIRDSLDSNLAVLYRDTGCSHILALSGMHLAVLAALIAFFLKKPLGLKKSAIAGAVIICLYCFLVGPMPSLNRSAIMYLIGVIAIIGAFPGEPMSILALSFLLQIIISPAEGNTISFTLSYIALAGIFIIGQPLFFLLSGKAPDLILQPFTASCGAFIASAGITCFTFGLVVPMGIITGLFLVPLTTVFMIGSMAWLALDMVSLSGFLDFPLLLIYQLQEKIVSFAGAVPGVTSVRFSAVLAISIAAALLINVLEYRRRASLLKLMPFD
ncbi:MAG: ComEC/Rec2 family competence protein [Treponema sp.]|jgi:competence protein ComEC|nr:ComEC/Rec2 family competence protein [Treponema sp.]